MPAFDAKATDQLTNLLRAEHYFGTYETCIDMGGPTRMRCSVRAVSGIEKPAELVRFVNHGSDHE